jgi:ribosomal protein L37E
LDEPSLDDSDDDDFAFADGKDDRPYEKAEGAIRECPHCHATVNPEAKACSACGFMLAKKARPINEPLERRWETGWPFRRRLTIFLICQALVLTLFASGFVGGMSLYAFPLPYVVFTGMTAFLFGTYNWIDLSRNRRGKLRMRQTWRICFFLRPTTTLRISDYEELAAGAEGHFGAINWIVVLFLVICGVFAGLVVGFFVGLKMLFLVIGGVVSCLFWWLFTWHKNTYFLSLCRDHGYPVVTLYRGWNREQMEDMAETICTVARLPLRR